MRLDPVLLEILATKLTATAEEMGNALQRSGRTMYVKETQDFGTGLVNHAGRLFAYPRGVGVIGMVDNDYSTVLEVIGELAPGDVVLTNHPFASGGLATHLPDLHLVKPYFAEGRIVGYGWCFVHSADVGGRVPSSISPSSHEIFQEGLMIPPVKIVCKGEPNRDMLAVMGANSRTSEENAGDLKAMLAALAVGERRVARIIEQHGVEAFEAAAVDVPAYSTAKARAAFRTIPDGTYEFWDYLDDDLVSPVPVRIHARMTVRDGLLDIDFSQTDPQVAAAFNLPSCGKRHTWLSLRLLQYVYTRDRAVPLNSGIFEPVTMTLPEGSLLNPVFPAAVGVRHATGNRVMDVLNGVLAAAVPDFMRAPGCGVTIPVVLAGPQNSDGDRQVMVVQLLSGGTGAMLGADGIDGRDPGTSGMSNNPIESIESSAPVTVHTYGVRQDSGGAGRWRGGVGLELTFSPKVSGCQVLARGMERHRFVPWGMAGGLCAKGSRTIKNLGRPDEQELGKIDVVDLEVGETITFLTPGGGGYGDPAERDPEAVLLDLKRGFISAQSARDDYKVVIEGGKIDHAATQALRVAHSSGPAEAGTVFDLGRERLTWESLFSNDFMSRINAALSRLPPAARRSARRKIFAPVLPYLSPTGAIDAAGLAQAGPAVERELAAFE
ncbi:MAG TPA: hydantoinase B/oxoprolinase family protein [Geminicoccus sp.]|uniref:hydantoinase B/oxoprolinase family protein n=1 Tax=Geminicoccus sp. TaxID=2024832 RepID=UPI002C5B9889|nr:hydantoinase B/oxoprolinase family protein [Geminicoccus sp.]HWL71634.1 hydantoinase B/oxoprolinase family protein [Geminicoccus sp.]